jgi:hypothetical protein
MKELLDGVTYIAGRLFWCVGCLMPFMKTGTAADMYLPAIFILLIASDMMKTGEKK